MDRLKALHPARYPDLDEYASKIAFYVRMALDMPDPDIAEPHVISLDEAADMPALAGGKARNVSLVAAETYLAVPPGFVVTAPAFNYFVEANGLRPELDALLSEVTLENQERLEDLCRELRQRILSGEVPGDMAGALLARAAELPGEGTLAVRSSAVAEDGELSFAGQYESLLDVPAGEVVDAYKNILASKYTPRAVAYRVMNGLADQETPMAVLVMPMVQARAAGVIYTLDMDRSQVVEGVLSVYAVRGTGDALVSGRERAQTWSFFRDAEPEPVQEPTAGPDGAAPALSPDEALALARAGLELEDMFGDPQDVEWAVGRDGRVVILQSRPLQREWREPEARRAAPRAEALIQDADRASRGVGAGVVAHLKEGQSFEQAPRGCVAVVENLLPDLAKGVERFAAVVARHGSRASHFASVAREFGLPVIIGVDDPFSILVPGTEVTVDADTGTIFSGHVTELLERSRPRWRKNPAMVRLNKALERISKLTLTDPEAENFTPESCRSLHDMVRFCHEKAVAEMFSLVGKGGRGLGGARKLESRLPLSMYVLDVDDGLFEASRNEKTVTPDDFKCRPMWFLWRGLASRDMVWDDGMAHMDWEHFDRIAGGIFKHDDKALASYAVLGEEYMHLLVRFGYHFSVLDVLCTPDPAQNYLNFRFKGGGGSLEQRMLRLDFLRGVLGHYDFITFSKSDMLDARLCRRAEPEMLRKLFILGRLLARTRLMDMGLTGREQVDTLVKTFISESERRAGEEFS